MTEELNVELFRISDDQVRLSIVSYRVSGEVPLAQTVVISRETQRPGHFVIANLESQVFD